MKYFNYVLILLGAVVALYSKAETEQNQYILIGGIVLLMIGIYRVSRNIPSKFDKENEIEDDENN
jgi:hypothetical membrane protein